MDDKENAKKTLQKGLKVAEKNGDAAMVRAMQDELSTLNEGPGGMGDFDLGSIMSNPMFANMAQQMMSNPQMMESMLSSLGGMGGPGAGLGGGPGGGVPPNMRENIDKMKNDPKFAVRTKIIQYFLIHFL